MKINIKKYILQYIMCIIVLFLLLFIVVRLFYDENNEMQNDIVTSIIEYKDDITQIYVEYPRFKDDKINRIITNFIYSYIKKFRNNQNEKKLDISYNLYYLENLVNITFDIEDTINNIKHKNILIDINNKDLSYITNVYDEEYLSNEIHKLVYYKYSNKIYEKIKNTTINNYTYVINDDKIDVYFNDLNLDGIEYIPTISISYNTHVSSVRSENTDDVKYIAFTYDDGPSKYTNELIKTLQLNDASATFFMIGNRMKQNEEAINEIVNSASEIGTHTYSHKNLKNLSNKEIEEEINSASVIFYQLTGKTYNYIRPPYGEYNKNIYDFGLNVILWNIDPKDWLLQDSEKIYNNVIKNACDGCIVLLHDTYEETIEATKMLLPSLDKMGYKVVSISKLLEARNHKIKSFESLNYIK